MNINEDIFSKEDGLTIKKLKEFIDKTEIIFKN